MPELGEAYVQIMPSTRGLGNKIKDSLNSEAGDAGRSAGNSIASTIKKIIATAGIGKVIKDALNAGGNLEQSYGGLETIYGEAAEQAKAFAAQAVSAGISANNFAEQAVSFGAALRQAYGGDMTKAMDAANTAIMDMADNSAKMGTDIGSIQAAYQGFAKQNYTMLDNLKLGYGGTKTEMERLLADAEKLPAAMGQKFDIDNLGDVYKAIHLIQEDLGLTGVAADEAKNTLTGSANAMKASWENLMAFMTSGEGDLGPAISALGENVGHFAKNVMRMLGNLAKNIPTLLSGISSTFAPMVSEMFTGLINGINTGLPKLTEGFKNVLIKAWQFTGNLPQLIQTGASIIETILNGMLNSATNMAKSAMILIPKIISGITRAIPTLFSTGSDIVSRLLDGFMSGLPDMLSHAAEIIPAVTQGIMTTIASLQTDGVEILNTIIGGITAALPTLLSTGSEMITQLLDSVTMVLPELLVLGTGILETIISGITEALPQLLATAGQLIPSVISTIVGMIPMILEHGAEIITTLVSGIIENLPTLLGAAAEMIPKIIEGIVNNLPALLSAGLDIIGAILDGIIQFAGNLLASGPEIFAKVKDGLTGIDWAQLGHDIVDGIKNGITAWASRLAESVRSIIRGAKEAGQSEAQTGSPSRLFERELGRWIPAGIAVGIEKNEGVVTGSMTTLVDDMRKEFNNALYGNRFLVSSGDSGKDRQGGGTTINQYIQSVPQTPVELASATAAYFEQARWTI